MKCSRSPGNFAIIDLVYWNRTFLYRKGLPAPLHSTGHLCVSLRSKWTSLAADLVFGSSSFDKIYLFNYNKFVSE